MAGRVVKVKGDTHVGCSHQGLNPAPPDGPTPTSSVSPAGVFRRPSRPHASPSSSPSSPRLRGAAGRHGLLRPQAAVLLPAQHRAQVDGGAHRLPRQGAEGRPAGPPADRLRHPQPRDPG